MNYSELIAFYQRNLLGEKDYRGFDPYRKLGQDQGSMNITAKKDDNKYRPYNQSSAELSTDTDQQLKKIDVARIGSTLQISEIVARELMSYYNINVNVEEPQKMIDSKSNLSLNFGENGYYLRKN